MSRENTKNTAETAENNDSLDARERAALEQAELAMQQLEDNNGYGDGDGSVRDFGTLLKSLRQYKKAAYLTPVLVAIEALFEVLIPTFMAFLIDQGLNKHDISKAVGSCSPGHRFVLSGSRYWCRSLRSAGGNRFVSQLAS